MSSTSNSTRPLDNSGWLGKNLSETRTRIETAALRYGRTASAVNLVAVSKQQTAESIRSAAASGQVGFGENYLQEALAKMTELADLKLVWHFIGQIQSNKTRPIAERFQWVHTVDRIKIAQRLNEYRPDDMEPLNICIQLKLADELGKGGAAIADLLPMARAIAALPRLKLRGLMCIPPPQKSFDAQMRYFKKTALALADLQAASLSVDTLSMGMSTDFEAAIAAGATIVRIGTAIFGERTKT